MMKETKELKSGKRKISGNRKNDDSGCKCEIRAA